VKLDATNLIRVSAGLAVILAGFTQGALRWLLAAAAFGGLLIAPTFRPNYPLPSHTSRNRFRGMVLLAALLFVLSFLVPSYALGQIFGLGAGIIIIVLAVQALKSRVDQMPKPGKHQ